MARSGGGGSVATLLVLLLFLVAGVGWNYQRNLAAERREPRPYRGYGDAELAALAAAFEQQSSRASRHYDAAVARRASAHEQGDFQGNVNEFERVQRNGSRTRDARADYASARVALDAVRDEQRRRAAEGKGLEAFLRRAFRF